MRHLKTHFFHIKSIYVVPGWSTIFVLGNEISPLLLGDELFLIDGVEENEYAATCSLDPTQNLDGVLNY